MSVAERRLDRARAEYAARPTYANLCVLERAEANYERAWAREKE